MMPLLSYRRLRVVDLRLQSDGPADIEEVVYNASPRVSAMGYAASPHVDQRSHSVSKMRHQIPLDVGPL